MPKPFGTGGSDGGDDAPAAGGSGAGGMTGVGGANAIGGASGTGGAAGTSGEMGGTSGMGGMNMTDGGADVSGDTGDAGDTADAGDTRDVAPPVNCVQALFGHYLLRVDNTLVYEADPPTLAGPFTAETTVLNDETGAPLTGATSVEDGTGYGYACAVLSSDHTVWCWRTLPTGNARGLLGNGIEDQSGPLFRATKALLAPGVPFTNVANVADVEPFEDVASCAVTSAGKIYCWGLVTDMLFGGLPTSLPTPTVVTVDGTNPFSNALQMTFDGTSACAVAQGATSRELWCWGSNAGGSLATGDMSYRRYPAKVVGVGNPSKVMEFGSYGTVCALVDSNVDASTGSNVRCWGGNLQGQVGNGTTSSPVLTPTLVTLAGGTTPLAGIVDIKGGGELNTQHDFVCALSVDHNMYCWGVGYGTNPTLVASNVMALGAMDTAVPRYVTSDGVYHLGQMTRTPNCGPLP